jgi:uncharacterized LabA/DUF88 family protein
MGVIYGGSVNLDRLKRAMIFIDGTNLFYRLEGKKLVVPKLLNVFTVFNHIAQSNEIVRIYLYSIQENIDKAKARHGAEFLDGIRVVLGDGVKNSSGGIKEKGVDALLVADLVYHAASRNCDNAVIVSTDTDFAHAIKRVEDFGCRTVVVGICDEAPDRLKNSCDRTVVVTDTNIVTANLGKII